MNIEIQNFISIFVFRYSPPWRFCAQICHIANVVIANIMLAVKVLTFTHLRKKNIEIQVFYFDFLFSIFGHLAFLCSILYYSMRAHCEYHFRSEDAQFEYRSRSDMPFSKSGELQDLRCSELNLFRSSLVNLRCRSPCRIRSPRNSYFF